MLGVHRQFSHRLAVRLRAFDSGVLNRGCLPPALCGSCDCNGVANIYGRGTVQRAVTGTRGEFNTYKHDSDVVSYIDTM